MNTTFTVGDITIHRVIEREEAISHVTHMFPDLSPDQIAELRTWMRPTSLTDDDMCVMCFQSYVLRTPHHTVLVDSCIGNHKRLPKDPKWNMQNTDRWMTALASHGLKVEDIDYVLCTHLHNDHVGWNTRLENGRWVPTFPNARYLWAEKEYFHWKKMSETVGRDSFVQSVQPVMEAGQAELVSNTHQLGDHLRLTPTPGHTPDHVAIRVGKDRDDAIIIGDSIISPLQLRYPEISPGHDFDKALSTKSRLGLLERYSDTPTLCCTMHFPSPSIGRFKRAGDHFRCEMLSG